MAGANSANTVMVTTSFAAYGSDYLFTATFTGFSKFFLADNNVVLPVDLLSFSGYLNPQLYGTLQWQTTNQFNLEKFEIERSYDGVQFARAGAVTALSNPATVQDYSFTDPLSAKPVNFYRLKMVDLDGRSKYSAIIKINNNKQIQFARLMQNPVQDQISLQIRNDVRENLTADLYNQQGQRVHNWNLGRQQGSLILPVSQLNLTHGVYILKVIAGEQTASLRLLKN